VTGDVLVSPEDGKGPPPWTTNSYAITPWLESLRRMEALDVSVIVPGQGPAMRDKTYLRRTIELFATILDQVHAALERGLVKLSQVQPAVDVDRIGREYAPGAPLPEDFHLVVSYLTKKAMQEAVDGAANLN
jgi:glyoxylase-like metal-dependent hydrolase (beta-lactamase superfamily II)